MPALAETVLCGEERGSPNVSKLETNKKKHHSFIYTSNLVTYSCMKNKSIHEVLRRQVPKAAFNLFQFSGHTILFPFKTQSLSILGNRLTSRNLLHSLLP